MQATLAFKPRLKQNEIPRVPNLEDLNEQLAYDVDVLLGYTTLRKQLGIAGALGRLLRDMEIKPYDAEDVEAYKDDMQQAKVDEINLTVDKFHKLDTYRYVNWVVESLAGYPDEIPPHVLDIARSIITRLPDVTFTVDTLRVDKRAYDPFLIASLRDEKFIIAVWDELDFERKQNEKRDE